MRRAAGARRRRRRGSTGRLRRRATAAQRFDRGFAAGHEAGIFAGRGAYGTVHPGTSIIIPTYNIAGLLRQCIASLRAHTPEPHEIIVVDNASRDDTARYLAGQQGALRYRVMDENRGFAGAVNAGLMMARGQTILLLNNDTIVTERWLTNLLICLNSDPQIGMVGPVTNRIDSVQQIDVPYRSAAGIAAYGRKHNVSNPALWTDTDRLVGFCLLFRRELLQRIGYFDEGYRIGNFEDDDYNLRTRLLGLRLVIARDAFIHHYGSVSMKALGGELERVNTRNRDFFAAKWGGLKEVLAGTAGWAAETGGGGEETVLYPAAAAVRCGSELYWLEEGRKRPLTGEPPRVPVVRVSRLTLRRYQPGEPIGPAEAAERWERTGGVAAGPDGRLFLLEAGRKRLIAGPAALEAWGLQLRRSPAADSGLEAVPDGLPVIAPPRVWERL